MEPTHRWHVGPFVVDAREHTLSRDGQTVPLARRSFSLLLALLSRPGELITKEELFATVWRGVVVSDAALSKAVRELRVALGDSASEPSFIATAHRLGFRLIAPVLSATPALRGDGSRRHLVGREAALAQLEAALAAAHTGHRQTVFVTGEAGLGKTALLETFVEQHASVPPTCVAQGRCIEHYGPGDAHLPLLELLEQLARQIDDTTFVAALSRFAPSWLAQLPWLLKPAKADARVAAETTPQRMLRELAHALEALSSRRTLVLWLEDLHWSDPSTLEALEFLAGRRDAARLLLVASFRSAGAGDSTPALRGCLLRLTQRGQARELALRPLDEDDIGRYLRERLGSSVALDELGAFVHQRSDGNPLFAVSLIDDLVRRGELVEEADGWRLRTSPAALGDRLPDSLRRLVHEQIERLSDADRLSVEAAAVVGANFSAAAAAAAAPSEPAEAEERYTRLALQGHFVERQGAVRWPDGTVSAGFRFVHALYWQGVHERVPEGRRAEWQRRIGLRLEQALGTQSAGIATELALRFEEAHDVERSLHYFRLAGSAALSRCAYSECIELLHRGLELVASLPPPKRPRHELDLLLPLGAALSASQSYAAAEAAAVYDRALVLCKTAGGAADLTRVLRGQWNVAFLRGQLAAARVTAQQLLQHAEAQRDGAMRIDALTKLGEVCVHQGDLVAARAHLQAALDSSASSADRASSRGAPRVAAYLSWVHWYRGNSTLAAQVGSTALNLARTCDSPHSKVFTYGLIGWLAVLQGDVDGVQALATQQQELAEEYGLAYWKQWALFLGGTVMTRRGDAAGGIAIVRAAIDGMRAIGAKLGLQHLYCVIAEALIAAGKLEEARAELAAASAQIAETGEGLYAAEIRRLEGEAVLAADGSSGRAIAKASFDAALEIARAQGALALEQRAASGLARHFAQDGIAPRALRVLEPVGGV